MVNNISGIIQDIIYANLRKENEEESLKHEKSGKLSAGKLGSPVQHQILNALKVEGKKFDNYTLGKFKRGNEVENFIVRMLEDETYNKQVECNYRDCVGIADLELHGDLWDTSYLPTEVKSVTNMAFKWILKEGEAKHGHKLQAGFAGLALKTDKYSVLYVASDDYRTLHLVYDTKDIKEEIDMVIDLFNATMESQEIPIFEAIEKWQSNPMYNSYPEHAKMKKIELKRLAKTLFNKKIT